MICRLLPTRWLTSAKQHLALGGERRIPIARGVDLGLGLVARPLQLGLAQRAVGGNLQ